MSVWHQKLPQFLDPFRLAESGQILVGTVKLSQFTDLGPVIADTDSDIQIELEFARQDKAKAVVTGSIKANLGLLCQRCLKPMDYPIDITVGLGFVQSDWEAQRLEADLEPYVVDEIPMPLNDIIEQELLLAIPQFPTHDTNKCHLDDKYIAEHDIETETVDNPFSVLSTLKKDK